MNVKIVAAVAALAIASAGCSSRPREFTPMVTIATADQASLAGDIATCRALWAAGKLNSNGRLASGAAGAAAGATTVVLGGAAASSAGLYGGMAVLGATLVALPFVAVAGAFGMAKIKRKKKEKAIQMAMTGCLAERGHHVTGWERAPKAATAKTVASAN